MTRLQDLLKQLPRLQIKFPQALTEFTLFPKLPVELRRTIWGIAAMEPRYIKVFILEARRRDSRIDGQSIAPAIMNTSQEARSEGKRFYTLVNERSPQRGPDIFISYYEGIATVVPSMTYLRVKPSYSNNIWINFSIDQFLLSYMSIRIQRHLSWGEYNLQENDLLKMKVLVIVEDPEEIPDDSTSAQLMIEKLLSMPNLQECVLVMKDWFFYETFEDHFELQKAGEDIAQSNAIFKKRKGLSYQFKVKWQTKFSPLLIHKLFSHETQRKGIAMG